MDDQFRLGVVGTGGLGTHLGRQARDVDDAVVAAIAEVDVDNRARAGDELDVDPSSRYADHERMLAEEDLDGVVIVTPHALHHEQVVAAMEAGCHVLCEKPLTTDVEHARDLVERAEGGDLTLMVGYQRHLSPPFRRVKSEVESFDEPPTFVTAEITQDWIDNFRDAWRTDPDLSGGGQLYDTGSHLVDALLWTTDLTPESVQAEMVFDDEEERVDRHAVLNVTFEEGAVGSISVSGDVPRVRENLRVWSDDGGVYLDGREWDEREVTLIDTDGTERSPRLDESPYDSKVAAFVEVARTGEEPPATARDALEVTALKEAAYESARTGRRISVDL